METKNTQLLTPIALFNSIGAKTDYSYSMYLIHYPLIMIFKELNFFTEKPFIAIICVFAVTFTASFLIEEIHCQFKVNKNLTSPGEKPCQP